MKKVRLKCQWDNGITVSPPGTEVEMERDTAFSLAGLGMVEILEEKEPPKSAKPSTATKGKGRGKGKKSKDKKTEEDTEDDLPDPDNLDES